MKHIFLKLGIITAIAFLGILTLPLFAHAQSVPVTEWAWSYMPTDSNEQSAPNNHYAGQGLGWINLGGNGGNVEFDPTTGQFSGYAWSQYGGWVDFNPSGPYPTGPNHGAQIDPTCWSNGGICPVTGWIKFIAGTGNNNQAGGWDGWVKMSGPEWNGGVVVDVSQRTITGSAWGDDVAGWIGFDGLIGEDIPDVPNTCKNNKGVMISYSAPYTPTNLPPECQTDTPQTCVDNKGNTLSYQGSKPYACQEGECSYKVYAGRLIKIEKETYYLADGLPSICSVVGCMDTDTASYSSVNAFNITNPNPLATVPGQCTYSCIGITDGKGYNYSANPPYTKNHPSQCIDGPVCTNPNGCPPSDGPVIPIYKEN